MASDPATSSAQTHYDRRVEIDFLYLDLSTCSRCLGSDENLRGASRQSGPILRRPGLG